MGLTYLSFPDDQGITYFRFTHVWMLALFTYDRWMYMCLLRIQHRQENPIYGRKWLVQQIPQREQWVTGGWRLSLVLGIREHCGWHVGSSKPRRQDLDTRPADLNSGASWFLSTGFFSVLETLALSWEAVEESLVEKFMPALSSFGVGGLLLHCH